jgi:hypothetical protein
VHALALEYGPSATEALARMAGLTQAPGAESEAVRVACLKELLARAYGKGTLPIPDDPLMSIFRLGA